MSIDDDRWFWSTEHGRDRMLRNAVEEIEHAHREEASALRSALSKVRGSLEQRLEALTTAFDAYVELGDLRERLRLLPTTLRSREPAAEAVGMLSRGALPDTLDEDDHDDWLARATNTVIRLVRGDEQPSPGVGESSDEFIVCTLLRLGRSDLLGGRLARYFEGADMLDPKRVLFLRACGAGMVDAAEMRRVGEALAPALSGRDDWLEALGISDDLILGFAQVEALLHGTPSAQTIEWDYQDTASDVEAYRLDLLRGDSPEERALLDRIAVLRWRVEHPTEEEPTPPEPVPATQLVEEMLLHPGTDPVARPELARWVREPIVDKLRDWQERPKPPPLEQPITVRSRFVSHDDQRHTITITKHGPDSTEVSRARRALAQEPASFGKSRSSLTAAGVSLVLAVIFLVLGGWWIGLAILFGVEAVVLFFRARHLQQADQDWAVDSERALERLDEEVAKGVDKLAKDELERDEALAEAVPRIDGLLRELGAAGTSARDRGIAVDPEPQPEPLGVRRFGAQPDTWSLGNASDGAPSFREADG